MGSWSSDQIRDAVSSSVMLTWAPGKVILRSVLKSLFALVFVLSISSSHIGLSLFAFHFAYSFTGPAQQSDYHPRGRCLPFRRHGEKVSGLDLSGSLLQHGIQPTTQGYGSCSEAND